MSLEFEESLQPGQDSPDRLALLDQA